MIPPLLLHGHIGAVGGLLWFFILLWVVVLLACGTAVVNLAVFLRPEERVSRYFTLVTILSVLLGLLLTAGGFVLHQNAPHEWNWWFLSGGALLLALTVGARVRLRAARRARA
ncbi:MAG: hypothetical protein H6831_08080 [Planctomycetes bacterium]|nr:hypothetical protein [Planctomycetota bacterium]MCB9904349.1 hypothetical protein [Planctomycetota bacterium]